MSRRRYPCYGRSERVDFDPPRECEACDQPAVGTARIQFSYMRGEDEIYAVCQRHSRMALRQVERFLAHVESKPRFLREKGR